jgi:hypothetical protein
MGLSASLLERHYFMYYHFATRPFCDELRITPTNGMQPAMFARAGSAAGPAGG